MLKDGVYFKPGYYEYNAFKVKNGEILTIACIEDPSESFYDYGKDKPVSKSEFNDIIDEFIYYMKNDFIEDVKEGHFILDDDEKLYSPTKKEWAEIKRQMKLQLAHYIN